MPEADGAASGGRPEAVAAGKRRNAVASPGTHGGAASSCLPPLSSINRPATPQLSLTLGEISGLPRSAPPTPASASTSNRHDQSFRGSSRAAAGGIQLHPMLLLRRRRPSQCSPIQLLPSSPVGAMGQSELGASTDGASKPAGRITTTGWTGTGRRIRDPSWLLQD